MSFYDFLLCYLFEYLSIVLNLPYVFFVRFYAAKIVQ